MAVSPSGPTTPRPAVLTPRQASYYLQVSLSKLRKLEKDGTLLPVRIGRAVRYRRVDIERYLNSLAAGV
jgi:excisionase family DNA binding protein